MPGSTVDVHEHLWPRELVEALRLRVAPPRLDGWTLYLDGEPPFAVAPGAHDVGRRQVAEPEDRAVAAVSLSSPLGIEALPVEDAQPLLDAWHQGARELPEPFVAWAATSAVEPDPDALKGLLADGFVGLQVPASACATPAQLERLAPVLRVCEEADRPVLVHPGPVPPRGEVPGIPTWWAPVVDYSAQLQSAWWAWHVAGRGLLPQLRICFASGAGLAPVHHERLAARGGRLGPVDHDVFVETSSYGIQAIDALIRALGIDVLVLGSDRPYAEPLDPLDLGMGAAAAKAISTTNPHRLLEGGRP